MSDDKEFVTDFISQVKEHDHVFITEYGFDDDADQILIEQYEDNHPLKPYEKDIFNLMYEDSFTEYVTKYIGHTFASDLCVVEHKLLGGTPNG